MYTVIYLSLWKILFICNFETSVFDVINKYGNLEIHVFRVRQTHGKSKV